MKRRLLRLDRIARRMNAWLLLIAIGLGMLDLAVLVAKSLPAVMVSPPATDHEQPSIHLPGNPVEAKQALSHRDLTRTKMDQIMLRRSIKPRTLLQTFYEILPSREGSGSRSKRRCKPG